MKINAISLQGNLLLRFSGTDRVRWLNGQISQDVRKTHSGTAEWACACNHKGKMDGYFTVCSTQDAMWLEADALLKKTLPMRLERYIIADDVTLDDVTAEWTVFHLLTTEPPPLPQNSRSHPIQRYSAPGTDVWVPAESAAAFANTLNILSETEAESLRITAGQPRWGRELSHDTLPPEAGIQDRAIDYHKGCYTGQEVISRMKTAGKTNRSLVRLKLTHGQPPSAAEDLPTPLLDEQGQPMGNLTSYSGENALGYLTRANLHHKTAKTQSAEWQVLT